MIPIDGWVATFRVTGKDDKKHYERLPVLFINDSDVMVIGSNGRMRTLRGIDGPGYTFVGLEQSTDAKQLIPGGGWLVTRTNDDGSTWTAPVLAWALQHDGEIAAYDTDSDGLVCKLGDEKLRFHHPDETST